MDTSCQKYILFLLFFNGIYHQTHTMDLTQSNTPKKKIICLFSDNKTIESTPTILTSSGYFQSMFSFQPEEMSNNNDLPINLTQIPVSYEHFQLILPIMKQLSENKIIKKKQLFSDKEENDLVTLLQAVDYLTIDNIKEKLIIKLARIYDASIKNIRKPNRLKKKQRFLHKIEKKLNNNDLYGLMRENMTTAIDMPKIITLPQENPPIKYSPTKKFKLEEKNNKLSIIQCSNNETIHTIENYRTEDNSASCIFTPDDTFILYSNKKSNNFTFDCVLMNLKTQQNYPINNALLLEGDGLVLCKFNSTSKYLLTCNHDKNKKYYHIRDLSCPDTIHTSFEETTDVETINKIEFYSKNKLFITKENKNPRYFFLSIIDLTNLSSRDLDIKSTDSQSIKITPNRYNDDYIIYRHGDSNIYLYNAKDHSLQSIEIPKTFTTLKSDMYIDCNKKNILIYGTNKNDKIKAFICNLKDKKMLSFHRIFIHEKLQEGYPCEKGCQCEISYCSKYISLGFNSQHYRETVFKIFNIETNEWITLAKPQEGLIQFHPTQPIVFMTHYDREYDKTTLILYDLTLKKEIGVYSIPYRWNPNKHLSKNKKLLLISKISTIPYLSLLDKVVDLSTGKIVTEFYSIKDRKWEDNNIIEKDKNITIKKLINICFKKFKYSLNVYSNNFDSYLSIHFEKFKHFYWNGVFLISIVTLCICKPELLGSVEFLT